MKITAVFDNVDSADQAVRRLREAGISVQRPEEKPLAPQQQMLREHFLLFPTAYTHHGMLFPYETPQLNPCVVQMPGEASDAGGETLLSVEIERAAGERARDILINQHARAVRFS